MMQLEIEITLVVGVLNTLCIIILALALLRFIKELGE